MNFALAAAYSQMEELQDEYNRLEHDFYSCRYKLWKAISEIKKMSPIADHYKVYEGKMRRDCKKKQRRGMYGKRPRGHQLDHHTPILWYYCTGEDSPEVVNSSDNMRWIRKQENRLKGIKRGEM